jgi:hypothetical protein
MADEEDTRLEIPATEVADMFGMSLWELLPALQAGDIPARISGHTIEVPAVWLKSVRAGDHPLPHYWPGHAHTSVGVTVEVAEAVPSMSDSVQAEKA